MNSRPNQILQVLALMLLFGVHAPADSVYLRGGERLIGKVLSEESGKVIFESQNLGRCEFSRDRVERIERDPSAPPAAPAPSPGANAKVAPATPMLLTNNCFFPWLAGRFGTNDPADWIQLKSGEWLRGRLKSLQDDTLEFDSDEFDLQEFDWEDVWQVYTPRLNEALFDNKARVEGTVHITRKQVLMRTSQGEQTFDRRELIALTPGGPREINYWSGKISAGMTLRSGNTEQTEFNVTANLKRRTPDTRFALDYLGNYAKLDGQEAANNARVTAQFDFWLSRHLYVKTPFAEYYYDPFQNIAHRATLGAAVGYEFLDRPRLKWDVAVGPGYQKTWFESVEAGDPDTEDNPAGLIATVLDTKITHRIDFLSKFQIILTPKDAGGYTHHWINTLELELTKRLDLDVSFTWDRVSNPATSSDGTTSKPDDFRTILSLGVNF